jgi:protein-S-isoprenylcysteine O-methyltransferase Ste14
MEIDIYQIIEKFDNNPVLLAGNIILMICASILLFSLAVDFIIFHKKGEVKKELRSWVETGTMFGYFIIYYFLIRSGLGKIYITNDFFRNVLIISGSALAVTGCLINVAGRINLRNNWANQVTIYKGQTLVTGGVYSVFRHPLYASIIFMLIGGCLINSDYIALLSVIIVFTPMMYYRAGQEEKLLKAEFGSYPEYQKKTGMFFPRIKK